MADEINNKNAVFKFYLNRQGVKGNKGEKGEQGFSPVIEVSENTANSYKLQITTETDQFETPNLRGDEIDTSQGGSYVRYNEETQQMYVGAADSASTTQAGMIRIASDEDIANLSENAALTPDGLVNNAGSILQSSDNSVIITQDVVNSKIDLRVDTSSITGDISRLEARVDANELLLGSHQISINNLDRDKVDKVTGKGLSTNDYTDTDKTKVQNALTKNDVDGDTIIYNSTTGKISATAQTPDLSNYLTKNTAQEVNNTKTFLGNSLQVGDGNNSDIVASYDSVIYPTTETGFSRVAGTVIGSLLQGSNSTLATQSMFEYDDDTQGFKIATIFNDFNLTGGTNTAIIKNAQTGKYEIVAHDTVYSQGSGIDINNANQISIKVDGTTVQFNANGELEAQTYTLPTASATTLGGVKVDGTTITIDNNGVISSSGGSTPSYMVSTDTNQMITGTKTFQNSNLILGTSTCSKFNLTNTYGDALRPESTTSTGLMHFAYNNYQNVATVSANRTNIDGSTRGLLRILPTTVYNHPETEGYIMTHNLVDMNYKPYLTASKITSTGGTVAITDNGINGINIEAAGGSAPTNMVTTDTEQTISGHKIFSDTSTEIAGDLYITQWGTSYIRMGDDTAYATPVLTMDDTNDILTVGDTGKFLKLKAYNTVVISNQRGNELTIGYDTLTYKKSDDTVVDLLALEARIAALEAQINGGNA